MINLNYCIDFCGASFAFGIFWAVMIQGSLSCLIFCLLTLNSELCLKTSWKFFFANRVSFLIIGRTSFICLWSCRLHQRTSTLPGNNNHLENIMYCNTQYWWWLFDQVGMPIIANKILCCSCFVMLSHTSPLLLVMAIIFLWHILVTHRVGKTLGTVSVIF